MEYLFYRKRPSYHGINSAKAEELYKATYIGPFCLRHKEGGWSERAYDVFYQPNPKLDLGHSYYFGLYINPQNQLMICDAKSFCREPFDAVIADNGEVVISQWRHDYRSSQDGSVWIDGGRDYTRSGVYPKERMTEVWVDDGRLKIFNGPYLT